MYNLYGNTGVELEEIFLIYLFHRLRFTYNLTSIRSLRHCLCCGLGCHTPVSISLLQLGCGRTCVFLCSTIRAYPSKSSTTSSNTPPCCWSEWDPECTFLNRVYIYTQLGVFSRIWHTFTFPSHCSFDVLITFKNHRWIIVVSL